MSNDGHGRVQTEDAANGPNVDGGPVVLAAEEDVGCPVPERHDLEEVGGGADRSTSSKYDHCGYSGADSGERSLLHSMIIAVHIMWSLKWEIVSGGCIAFIRHFYVGFKKYYLLLILCILFDFMLSLK